MFLRLTLHIISFRDMQHLPHILIMNQLKRYQTVDFTFYLFLTYFSYMVIDLPRFVLIFETVKLFCFCMVYMHFCHLGINTASPAGSFGM